jgi:hypothetical protein
VLLQEAQPRADRSTKTGAVESNHAKHESVLQGGSVPDRGLAYASVIQKWIARRIKDEPLYINGHGETSHDFRYVANGVQTNLLAATRQNPEAIR